MLISKLPIFDVMEEKNMGTILKYVFYLILIVVIFLVGRGIYEGSIDSDTTVGEVVEQVDAGAKNMVKSGSETVEKAADDYKKAPKKDIVID